LVYTKNRSRPKTTFARKTGRALKTGFNPTDLWTEDRRQLLVGGRRLFGSG
jgi:hypothetical protein